MKTKDKFFTLLKEGFKLKTLRKMNESQLNVLYKKVVKEQGVPEKVTAAAAASEKLTSNLKTASEMLETDELTEDWGSSDQNIMNASIHRSMGEPEEMPSPFDSRLESAAESAVDFYWDDWEEYQTNRQGLIDTAKRLYLRRYFPEKFNMLIKMFQPVKKDGELDEADINNINPFKGGRQTQRPEQVGPSSDDGMDNYQDGMGIFEGKKKPSKMKTPITTLGMFEDEIKEKFRSKAQQGYFFAKCEEEGPKSKWCKMAREFADDTKDFSKLPDKVETNEGTRCWKGYEKKGMKTMFGKRVPNCVKKESKEDKVRQIEESIVSLLKNHKKPTMTKKDLLEQGTKEAPVKTPTKTPSKPDRKTPYQPKHKPKPKAGDTETIPVRTKPNKEKPGKDNPYKPKHKPGTKAGDTKTAPTRTKPGTKEKPGKSTPYQPKHRPAPKAGETQEIPSFLKFDNLNITFRDE